MNQRTTSVVPLALLASIVAAAHYEVTVGQGNQLKFVPESITAAQGDTVTYKFFSKVCRRRAIPEEQVLTWP
jgi:plastocyanin